MAYSLPYFSLIDAALRGMLLALLLLLALSMYRLHRHPGRRPVAQAAGALALGLCVQVIGATPAFESAVPSLWQAPLVAVSVGNAVLFWVFVQALFDDNFAWRALHALAWLVAASLSVYTCVVGPHSGSDLARLAMGVQRAVPLVFAVLASVAAAAHWRADLVEPRRRIRAFIFVTGLFYSMAMLATRLGSPQGRMSATASTFDVVILLAIVAVVAWHVLRLADSELFSARSQSGELVAQVAAAPPGPAAEVGSRDPAETQLCDALQRLMVEQRAYLSEDLTVASLAARLAVPEYRLRRLINQRLGHRNFNTYVNGFRLDAARAALADPAHREVSVLTLALDAGFQSIGPFNRAFKASTGLTPSEYRREKQMGVAES